MKDHRIVPRMSCACTFIAVLCLSIFPEAASGGEKHKKRSEWTSRHSGSLAGTTYEAWEALFEIANSAAAPPVWSPVGPTNYVSGETLDNSVNRLGRVNTVAFHPTDPHIIYAGTPLSSLWEGRLTAGRIRWQPFVEPVQIRKSPQLLAVSGIAIDPDEPDRMYVLTGDGIGGVAELPALPSFGVMKSLDGGKSWKPTPLAKVWDLKQFPNWGLKLTMDPCNSERLFVVTNHGIYRTTDGGEAWQLVQAGFFRDFEFQPPTSCSEFTAILVAATLATIYRSTDGGETWQQSRINLPDSVANASSSEESFIELAVTPADPEIVYALVGEDDLGFIGFYHSADEGETFSIRSKTPNILGSDLMGANQGALAFFGGSLAVSPVDPEDIYVGRANSWRSGDGGLTWCITSYWQELDYISYMHSDVHTLDFRESLTSEGSIFDLVATTDGGVSRAPKATASPIEPAICPLGWQDFFSGLRVTQTFKICGHASEPGLVYLGNQDNGTFRLGGSRRCHEGTLKTPRTACSVANGDGGTCLIHPTNSQVAVVSKQSGRLYRSTGDGDRVVSITPPVNSQALSNQYLTPLAGDLFEPETLFACYDDVWKTSNHGGIWENLTEGLLGDESCIGLAVARADHESQPVIYVAKKKTSGGLPLVFWSRNGGSSWQAKVISGADSESGSYGTITDIVASVSDSNQAWITTLSNRPDTDFGVFNLHAVNDELRKFEHKLVTLPSQQSIIKFVQPLAIVNAGKTEKHCDRLFVGTRTGVFYGECAETACNWMPFMHLPLLVLDLQILFDSDNRPSNLLAASYGQGAWELEDPLRYTRSDLCEF